MKNTAKIWVVGRCLVAVVQLARKVVQLTGGNQLQQLVFDVKEAESEAFLYDSGPRKVPHLPRVSHGRKWLLVGLAACSSSFEHLQTRLPYTFGKHYSIDLYPLPRQLQ